MTAKRCRYKDKCKEYDKETCSDIIECGLKTNCEDFE